MRGHVGFDQPAVFLWGKHLNNVLRLWSVPSSTICYSRPRIGSRWAQSPSGVRDAWITGEEFIFEGDFRWLPAGDVQSPGPSTGWTGPAGIRAFLHWMRDTNNKARFFPAGDLAGPATTTDYVECHLDNLEELPPDLEPDFRDRLRLRFVSPTTDFAPLVSGEFVNIGVGGDLQGATFSRSSVAYYVGSDGLIKQAASGALRVSWYDLDGDGIFETPAILLEGARTNLVTWSDELSNWSNSGGGAPTVTNGFAVLGDLGLALLDDSTAQDRWKFINVTFTGDGVKGWLFYVRSPDTPADADLSKIRILDVTAGQNRIEITPRFNPDGTLITPVSTSGGVVLATRRLGLAGGKPVYAIYCQTDSITAANSHRIEARPAGFTAADTGKMVVGGVMVEDAAFPSEVRQKTTGSTQARAADSLTQSVALGPRDSTWYWKLVRPIHADASGTLGEFPTIFFMAIDDAGIVVFFDSTTRTIRARVDGGTNQEATRALPAGATLEGAVQVRNLTSGGQIALNVNDGQGFTAFSAATEAISAFGSQTLRIGDGLVAQRSLSGGFISLKTRRGLRALDQLRKVA